MKPRLLIGILTLIVSIIVCIYYLKRETFTDYSNQKNIGFCPFDTIQTIYNQNTLCCDEAGTTMTGSCKGKTVCSQSGDSKDVPSCGKIYREYLSDMAKKHCPASLPNYYEKNSKESKISFCFGGDMNSNYGPITDNQDKCIVYKNDKTDKSKEDSCYNRAILDSVPCLTPEKLCKKGMIIHRHNDTTPAIIWQTFMINRSMFGDNTKIESPAFCYDNKSLENYLNATRPGWQTKENIDLNDFMWICNTARDVYINKTRPESSVKYR